MKNIGLTSRVLLGGVISSIFLMLTGFFIWKGVKDIQSLYMETLKTEKRVASISELKLQISKMESGIRAYLLGGRPEDLKPFSETEGIFDKYLTDLKKEFKGDKKIVTGLTKVLELKHKWLEVAAVNEMLAVRKLRVGMIDVKQFSQIIINSEGNKIISDLKDEVEQIEKLLEIDTLKSRMNDLIDQMVMIIALALSSTIILSFLFQMAILRSVKSKFISVLESLNHSSEEVESAGHDCKLESLSLKEECGILNTGLESNSATMVEISEMGEKNAQSTARSLELSKRAGDDVVEGRKLLKGIEESFNDVTSSNKAIESSIKEKLTKISESLQLVEKIADKTKLINDIVFQTKLLSFNASVEAARAGDHGRGFSVVAEEITNLAKVSGESAASIEEIIGEAKSELNLILEESLKVTSKLFQENNLKLSQGEELVTSCSEKYNQILMATESISESFKDIQVATDEQSQGLTDASHKITDLESASRNCLKIADKSLENIGSIESAISVLNQEIVAIEHAIFGKSKRAQVIELTEKIEDEQLSDSEDNHSNAA